MELRGRMSRCFNVVLLTDDSPMDAAPSSPILLSPSLSLSREQRELDNTIVNLDQPIKVTSFWPMRSSSFIALFPSVNAQIRKSMHSLLI